MIIENFKFVRGFALQGYLSAEEGIVAAKNYGYDHWYIDGSLESEMPDKWSKQRISGINEMIEAMSIKPIFHGNFKAPLGSDVEQIRRSAVQYVKTEIDLASELSSPLILHGSCIVEPRLIIKAKRHALSNYLKSLEELSLYAERSGVTLLLENLSNYKHYRPFHYIFTTEDEFKFILDRIDLNMFYDVGHANIGNNDPIDIFKRLHSRIYGMSFSNNDGNTDQHFSMLRGLVDYNRMVAVIKEVGWTGLIGFETRDVSPDKNIRDLMEMTLESLKVENG